MITKQECVQPGPFKGCLHHPIIYYYHLIFSRKRVLKKQNMKVCVWRQKKDLVCIHNGMAL